MNSSVDLGNGFYTMVAQTGLFAKIIQKEI